MLEIFGGISKLSMDEASLREMFESGQWVTAIIASTAFHASQELAHGGYYRTDLTSQLVGDFIRGSEVTFDADAPSLSRISLGSDTLRKVEALKHFIYDSIIMSSRLKLAEHRGKDIVKAIFKALDTERGYLLLPDDFQRLYRRLGDNSQRKRVVCDFIAGMTDRYALEFHDRLYSTSAESIWKPT